MVRNNYVYGRRFFAGRRRNGKSVFWMKFVSIIIILGLLTAYSENRIKPYLEEISENKVRDMVNSTVNSVIQEGFKESTRYEDLVTVVRNEQGQITNIETDVEKMNRLAAEVSAGIRSKLTAMTKDYIAVPAGVLTGTALFAGTGPELNIRVKPYGNVHTEFKSEFTRLSDNQTKHSIFLIAKTSVLVAVPLLNTKYELTSGVPVAESVLIGGLAEEPAG